MEVQLILGVNSYLGCKLVFFVGSHVPVPCLSFMAKIETLSLEVDGILPDTRVFRERFPARRGGALLVQSGACARATGPDQPAARSRGLRGALRRARGLLALTGHGDGVRRLPFRTSEGVTLGDGAASVVLPTALLQARLTGADGASAVVQAGSPFVRDLIVSTARKFAM